MPIKKKATIDGLAGLELGPTDDILLRTDDLAVWIMRPNPHHTNWFICYYAANKALAVAWDIAIKDVFNKHGVHPFHQICWQSYKPTCQHETLTMDHYTCPFATQGWELWTGCSDYALAFPADPLEDIHACGDPALEQLLAVFPEVKAHAEAKLPALQRYYSY